MNGVGLSKQLVSPMMKRVAAESCYGLIGYGCSGPCMCMNCVQPKEARSFYPFCDLGRNLSLFPFTSFYFLIVGGMLSPSELNLPYVHLYSISDRFFLYDPISSFTYYHVLIFVMCRHFSNFYLFYLLSFICYLLTYFVYWKSTAKKKVCYKCYLSFHFVFLYELVDVRNCVLTFMFRFKLFVLLDKHVIFEECDTK